MDSDITFSDDKIDNTSTRNPYSKTESRSNSKMIKV